MIMATFHSWLNDQLVRPETDPVGWLARQWKSHEGNRPRVSSPTGIGRFLEDQAGDETAKGYVTEAVKAATVAYRDRDAEPVVHRDGTPANAAAEAALNPSTGKPVAVVPGAAWVTHPDASQYGSCGCGWARGLANSGDRQVITCAAGHMFVPEAPAPTGQGSETIVVLSGPLTPVVGSGGSGELAGEQMELPVTPEVEAAARGELTGVDGTPIPGSAQDEPTEAQRGLMAAIGLPLAPGQEPQTEDMTSELGLDADGDDRLEQILVTQGMIMHVLTRIARHVGLAPEQLDTAVDAAVAWMEAPLQAPQAPVPPGYGDLSSQLYGLAGQPASQPPNPPQAYASWFSAAEYGDPGSNG